MISCSPTFLSPSPLPSVGFIMFGNHYVRDSLGALEKQFESHLGYTTQEYANLNALYFFPNIITPLLAGMVLDKIGVSRSFLYAVLIASVGHLFFALGIQIHSKIIVFLARGLSGSVYEIIDALLPITYLGPLFQNEFQIVVGFMQVFIRFGSVANFIISPLLYREFGLTSAFWVAALVGCSSIPLLLGAMNIEKQYIEYLGIDPVKELDLKKTHEFEMTALDEENETSSLVLPDRPKSSTTLMTSSNSSRTSPSVFESFASLLPLHRLPLEYYLWLLSGSLTYGAIVPFWFIGSKYLQDYYSQTVIFADTLMTIPEGMVVLLGFPLALLSKKYKWDVTQCLIGLSLAQLGMCISLLLLTVPSCLLSQQEGDTSTISIQFQLLNASSYHNSSSPLLPSSEKYPSTGDPSWSLDNLLGNVTPIFCLLLLGISFSFSCSFFWGSITHLVPNDLLSQASGVVSCGVNILPTSILPLITFITSSLHTPNTIHEIQETVPTTVINVVMTTGNITMISLSLLGFLGTIASLAAAVVTSQRSSQHLKSQEQSPSPGYEHVVPEDEDQDMNPVD
jgi:MFS family permease